MVKRERKKEKRLKIAAASCGVRTQHRPRDTSCALNRPNALPKKTETKRFDEEMLKSAETPQAPRTYRVEEQL
jgi:hypothetical protein